MWDSKEENLSDRVHPPGGARQGGGHQDGPACGGQSGGKTQQWRAPVCWGGETRTMLGKVQTAAGRQLHHLGRVLPSQGRQQASYCLLQH